jgi:hypothetical protein
MKNIFNIDSIKNYDSTLEINENYNKDNNIFYLDFELIKELKNNHREEYKIIGNKLENDSINIFLNTKILLDVYEKYF